MQRADTQPEELWAAIEARKQAPGEPIEEKTDSAAAYTVAANGERPVVVNPLPEALDHQSANGAHGLSEGSRAAATGPLVDALYRTLQRQALEVPADGARARAQLSAVIAASSTPVKDVRAPRPFWQLKGHRQVVLAVALLLITAAALGYTAWSSRHVVCPPDQSMPLNEPTLPGSPNSPRGATLPVGSLTASFGLAPVGASSLTLGSKRKCD